MAIVQISKIQTRRGLNQDLPQLDAGELAWSVDTRQLYIGNGTLAEGAPITGHTEILTQFSILDYQTSFSANVGSITNNVAVLQSNVTTINNQIAVLQAGSLSSNVATLLGATTGTVTNTTANNGIITYTLSQGTAQRTGTIKYSFSNSTVSYDEEYSQDAATVCAFTMTANATYANLNYNTTGTSTTSTLKYRLTSL